MSIVNNIIFTHQDEFKKFLIQKIKVDPNSLPYFTHKNNILFFFIEQMDNRFCNIIKQDMISCGGDAAISKEISYFKKGKSSALLMGTQKQFQQFSSRSLAQPSAIKNIGKEIFQCVQNDSSENLLWSVKNKNYSCENKTYIMGIFNPTPDSFFDGGEYFTYEKGIKHLNNLIKNKADIIDIGGESSRPGAKKVSAKEEIKRILPFMRYVKKNHKGLLSIDTYKSEVAKAALEEGADIINDISALQADKKMAKIIGHYKAGVVLMHMKGKPSTMQIKPVYKNLMNEIKSYLHHSIKIALENGIRFNNIIIDPGIGFGKTLEHNYIILNKLEELKIFHRPIMVGLSMKSLIGKVLNNKPEERLIGTISINTVGILKGANIIRVHHVKEHKEIITLLEFFNQYGVY